MIKNKIIIRIFNLSEVTYTSTKFVYIDKYSNNWIEISDINEILFMNDLLTFDILKVTSGNFETKELHYRLNENFYKTENGTRTIFFNRILEKIDEMSNYYNSYSNIKKVFEDFKINEIRKQKLNNLNLYGLSI